MSIKRVLLYLYNYLMIVLNYLKGMIMNNNLMKALAVAASLCVCGNSNAEGYWGLGLGNASYDIKPFFGMFEVEDGLALRGFWGMKNENFGLEGEGTFSMHDWVGSGGDASHNVFNMVFSAVGYLPINDNVSFYGKAGLDLWSTSVDVVGTLYEGDSGIDIAFGLGVDFTVSEKTHVRVQYSAYSGIGDGLDEGDMDIISFDLAFYQ